MEAGGTAIVSTPYHDYLRNLALALNGRMDKHFTALWDYEHIKLCSMATLSQLFFGTGFVGVRFKRVGRIPPLARSLILIAREPEP